MIGGVRHEPDSRLSRIAGRRDARRLASRPRHARAQSRAGRQQRVPRRARRADPGRYRPPSRASRPAAGLCARARAGRSPRSSTPTGISITAPAMPRSAPPYPRAELYASNAIEGALAGFLARSRASIERQLAAGQIPEANRAEVRRAFQVMDNPASLRPTRPVTASGDDADRRPAAAGEPRAASRRPRATSGFTIRAAAPRHRRRPRRRAGAVHGYRLPRRLAPRARRDRRDATSTP